jgi:hypothetical protein
MRERTCQSDKRIGAVGHQVARADVGGTMGLKAGPMHRECGRMSQQPEKIGRRVFQTHLEGGVIERAHTQFLGRQTTGEDRLGVLTTGASMRP